jgi:hypothetical protein
MRRRGTTLDFAPYSFPIVAMPMSAAVRRSIEMLCASAFACTLLSCSDTSGPAVAVTLDLYSVDGVVIPVPTRSAGGKAISIGNGRLQGTNRGFACGMSLQLSEGPITAVEIPDCRLFTRQEKTVSATLTDSRFPSGPHTYRFFAP